MGRPPARVRGIVVSRHASIKSVATCKIYGDRRRHRSRTMCRQGPRRGHGATPTPLGVDAPVCQGGHRWAGTRREKQPCQESARARGALGRLLRLPRRGIAHQGVRPSRLHAYQLGRGHPRVLGSGERKTRRRDALNELFWARNRGAIGVRQLWEQLRDHPQQKAAPAASDGREGWISWREVRRYYALWEAPQLRHEPSTKPSLPPTQPSNPQSNLHRRPPTTEPSTRPPPPPTLTRFLPLPLPL
eukprot:COSAG04_NODE_5089_length_1742_cov_2.369446_2_plen_245_part_00